MKYWLPKRIDGKDMKKDGFNGDQFKWALQQTLGLAGVVQSRIDQKRQEVIYQTKSRPGDAPRAGLVWEEVKIFDDCRST